MTNGAAASGPGLLKSGVGRLAVPTPDFLCFHSPPQNDEHLRPAVLLYDVRAPEAPRRPQRWFPGPDGRFYFDQYLFSVHPERGTSAWDIHTGQRLLLEPEFHPTAYHPGARRFITQRKGGTFLVSALISK